MHHKLFLKRSLYPTLVIWIFASICAFSAFEANAQSATESLKALAQIEAVSEQFKQDIQIVRKSGKRETVAVGKYLYPGDKLSLRNPAAWVSLLQKGSTDAVTIKGRTQRLYAVNAKPASISSWWNQVAAKFDFLFQQSNVTRASTAAGRGDGGTEQILYGLKPNWIHNDQILPLALEEVAVAWQGAAIELQVVGDDGVTVAEKVVIGKLATTITIPSRVKNGLVRVVGAQSGEAIQWRFQRKRLTGSLAGGRDLDNTLRQILMGPAEYKSEGLSHLYQLSKSDFTAERFWIALVEGSLAPNTVL
jgi:hypothetical protein